MSVYTVTTRISRKWLERKTKSELASIILNNIDRIDLFAEKSELIRDVVAETANRCAELAKDHGLEGGIAQATPSLFMEEFRRGVRHGHALAASRIRFTFALEK